MLKCNRLFLALFFWASPAVVHADSACHQGKFDDGRINCEIFIDQLGHPLAVFNTVWMPHVQNNVMMTVLAHGNLKWAKRVLDVGTGTGVLGLIALKQGAGMVIATDINPMALADANYNARMLGFGKIFRTRLVRESDPTAYAVIGPREKFDLIISDPPWNGGPYPKNKEYGVFDPDRVLLKSLVINLKPHLRTSGKAWIYLGNKDALSLVFSLAKQTGLMARVIDSYHENAVIELHETKN